MGFGCDNIKCSFELELRLGYGNKSVALYTYLEVARLVRLHRLARLARLDRLVRLFRLD